MRARVGVGGGVNRINDLYLFLIHYPPDEIDTYQHTYISYIYIYPIVYSNLSTVISPIFLFAFMMKYELSGECILYSTLSLHNSVLVIFTLFCISSSILVSHIMQPLSFIYDCPLYSQPNNLQWNDSQNCNELTQKVYVSPLNQIICQVTNSIDNGKTFEGNPFQNYTFTTIQNPIDPCISTSTYLPFN